MKFLLPTKEQLAVMSPQGLVILSGQIEQELKDLFHSDKADIADRFKALNVYLSNVNKLLLATKNSLKQAAENLANGVEPDPWQQSKTKATLMSVQGLQAANQFTLLPPKHKPEPKPKEAHERKIVFKDTDE